MRLAVKVISKKKFYLNKDMKDDIKREIRMLRKLQSYDHAHIVHMYGHCESDDAIFIVMELCEGGELMEQLEHNKGYSETDAARIIETMAGVLMHLHGHGIVHRDIKPENLLLHATDDLSTVKMADFGLANVMEGEGHEDKHPGHDIACGTPAYMAPEVYHNQECALNPKVDMWSLGVVAYLLLCGNLPFTGQPADIKAKASRGCNRDHFQDDIWTNISDAAQDLIMHLICVDPSKRFDAQQVMEHPWITGEDRGDTSLDTTARKIALFNAKKKFRGFATAVIATNRMQNAFGTKAKRLTGTVGGVSGAVLTKTRAVTAPWTAPLEKFGGKYAHQAFQATSGFVDKTLDATDNARYYAADGISAAMDNRFVAGTLDITNKTVTMGANLTASTASMAGRMAVTGVDRVTNLAIDKGLAPGAIGRNLTEFSRDLNELVPEDTTQAQLEQAKQDARDRNAYFAAVRMDMVAKWLHWNGLDVYASRFFDAGYDDIEVLKELQGDEEINEVLEDLNIPRGHKYIMRAAMADLVEHGWEYVPEDDAVAAMEELQETPMEPKPVLFSGVESHEEVLDRLFKAAMDAEHPGIDPAGIRRMKELIKSGRFSTSYYIAMWIKRLQDVSVVVEWPRRVVFQGDEGDSQKMKYLLEVALGQKINGIDKHTVKQMMENVANGQFSAMHYTTMWTQRLVEAGVPVFDSDKDSRADTKKREKEYLIKQKKVNQKFEKRLKRHKARLRAATIAAEKKQNEDHDSIVARRKVLEEIAWQHRVAGKENSHEFSDSDTEEEDGQGAGLLTDDQWDALEAQDGVGVGGHMVHDSVSEFDLDAWNAKQAPIRQQQSQQQAPPKSSSAIDLSSSYGDSSLTEWRSQQSMQGGHEDRIDGPLFASEMNQYEIDEHVTHITTSSNTVKKHRTVAVSFDSDQSDEGAPLNKLKKKNFKMPPAYVNSKHGKHGKNDKKKGTAGQKLKKLNPTFDETHDSRDTIITSMFDSEDANDSFDAEDVPRDERDMPRIVWSNPLDPSMQDEAID